MNELLQTIERYRALGIEEQIDYKKFYLYSLITHSTALSLEDADKQYENYFPDLTPDQIVPNKMLMNEQKQTLQTQMITIRVTSHTQN